tara:strand:+ start:708 stop:1145 length:438 start_codon:yes stop_codon:yes gene_type:complete
MPFALIPDGFTLKKVTKAQEQAVKDKRRHDDIIALLNNPAASTAIIAPIIAIATGAAGAAILEFILNLLKDEGVAVSNKIKDRARKGVENATSATGAVKEAVTTGQITGGGPVAVDVANLPELLIDEAFRRLGLKQSDLQEKKAF